MQSLKGCKKIGRPSQVTVIHMSARKYCYDIISFLIRWSYQCIEDAQIYFKCIEDAQMKDRINQDTAIYFRFGNDLE